MQSSDLFLYCLHNVISRISSELSIQFFKNDSRMSHYSHPKIFPIGGSDD